MAASTQEYISGDQFAWTRDYYRELPQSPEEADARLASELLQHGISQQAIDTAFFERDYGLGQWPLIELMLTIPEYADGWRRMMAAVARLNL